MLNPFFHIKALDCRSLILVDIFLCLGCDILIVETMCFFYNYEITTLKQTNTQKKRCDIKTRPRPKAGPSENTEVMGKKNN